MKNLLLGIAFAVSTTAFAQTTSTQQLPSTNTTNTAAPTNTLTTTAPGLSSRFGALLLWQSWTTAKELREHDSKARIDSDNGIGLTFKATDKLKTEIRHRFAYTIVGDSDRLEGQDAYQLLDPTIHANYASDLRLFGSNPIVFNNRYYIPLSEASRESTSRGVLRSQIAPDWDLSPRVNISYMLQARLFMYENNQVEAAGATGGDSALYFLTGPSVTYNFGDKLNAYYFPYLATTGTRFQYGDLRSDLGNTLAHEVGFNIVAGPVEINPAYSLYTTALNREGYEDFGDDQVSEYSLVVSASF